MVIRTFAQSKRKITEMATFRLFTGDSIFFTGEAPVFTGEAVSPVWPCCAEDLPGPPMDLH